MSTTTVGRNYKVGISSGLCSGIFWGLSTVLSGIILLSGAFVSTEASLILAPIVGAFLNDFFSSTWMTIYSIIKGTFVDTLKLLKTKSGKAVAIAALFGGPLGMGSYLLAINFIGAGYAASISAVYPVAAAFFSYIFLKEKLKPINWLGLCLSVIAIIFLWSSPGETLGDNFILGFIFALGAVIGWALESVICAYGMKDDEVDSVEALQIRQLVSSFTYGLLIVPIMGGLGLAGEVVMSNLGLFIAGASLIGTLSYVFYYKSIATIGPVKATGLNVTFAIWAIVFDLIISGNTVTIELVICAIIIIIGTVLVTKK